MSAADLTERLRALLEEARDQGRAAELRPLLEEFLVATRADPPPAGDDPAPELPMRHGMIGGGARMQALFELIERTAASDVPILVLGETGSGKELVAQAIHTASGRRGRFVAENCAAVPANLLESELFGHTKGSFTGAVADREGRFVSADGGTLFLDEIGDMPLDMQAKLLRVLESGEVRAVGSNRTRKVDVRVVAATHRDLAGMVAERTFRQDLYYRLNVISIEIPPLRERPEDVQPLVEHFLRRAAVEAGRPAPVVEPEALTVLEACPWPGNVRQLENEIRRAVALGGERMAPENLSPGVRAPI